MRIEIVGSPDGALSSMSAVSRGAAQAVLAAHYHQAVITLVRSVADLEALVARRPDLVFLGMHFVPRHPELGLGDPERIWISQYLADHGIACTGSDHLAQLRGFDKSLAKQRIQGAGLATAPFLVAAQGQLPAEADLPLAFPLFVKPVDRGGGEGIDNKSLVHNYAALQAKVRAITTDLQADSLIESYLPGQEFSVAILKKEHSIGFSVLSLELIAPPNDHGQRFLSAAVKAADTERFRAITDKTMQMQVETLAIKVFHALGARDYGRIDIRLDALGVPHFLEANLLPSLLNGYGNFPKACKLHLGLDYEPMILRIVRLGLLRRPRPRQSAPRQIVDVLV